MKKTLSILSSVCLVLNAHGATRIEPSANGAIVETDRCRVTIADGFVSEITNKLTGESYLKGAEAMEKILPHFPAGLGTQAGDAAYIGASQTFKWPWAELPLDIKLPNQHFPTNGSKFQFNKTGENSATLTYKGLSDGKTKFSDEDFLLNVEVDSETTDILITPSGKSNKPGVYGANLLFAPTKKAIAIQAPIFDGVKLTSDMPDCLWHTKWPDYWDYSFLALEGEDKGAIGLWAQDLDLNYKSLFYRIQNGGIALSLATLSTPPYEKLTEAKGVTWRIQAFDKGWTQAATRFRDWRLANVKVAPRPDWTKRVSFVNSGVNASEGWLKTLKQYVGEENLGRTVTFAPVIRAAAFDTKHWDNTPYEKFKSEMPAWKQAGPKLMAYLQPMIMWGKVPPDDKEAVRIKSMSEKADTIRPFTHGKIDHLSDQHNLAEPEWQAWFLNWVHSYIADYGADGVYHDQSYPCPIDNRGLINGMRSTQGMADYFYKAATQNPDSIHGSEHLQEANSVGASLGIGSGVLWGTAPAMRKQRIEHPSPVSNALHYPNATLWSFPHYSDIGYNPDATIFHWGMDQMEGRGDIAGLALQNTDYNKSVENGPFWRNEIGMDRLRSKLFIKHGLRPVYPDDWDRNTRTYFKGAQGEDFRYENTPWGSQFVQMQGDKKTFHYGRATGVRNVPTDAGIAGWVFYNPEGPSGLSPSRYYVIDPSQKRPAVYFSPAFEILPGLPTEPSFYEGYVENGCGNNDFAMIRVEPIPEIGRIIKSDKIFLNSPTAPKFVFVNGKVVEAKKTDNPNKWLINFEMPSNIVAIISDPAPGVAGASAATLARAISSSNLDMLDTTWFSGKVVKEINPNGIQAKLTVPLQSFGGIRAIELEVPFKAPDTNGTLKVTFPKPCPTIQQVLVNGLKVDVFSNPATTPPIEIPCKPGEVKFLSIRTDRGTTCVNLEWVASAPAP